VQNLVNMVSVEVGRALSRFLTGKLLTEEQIRTLSTKTVGKYLADWLPTTAQEAHAQERVEEARHHITQANTIISGLRHDLERQATHLEALATEIEEKKQQAERYALLASTNRTAFAALRAEMEDALRKELETQANRGKRLRQVASFILWLVTLVLGAALGAYFPQLMVWVRTVV
jgi:predicted RNase H-like nuclease (RuvC/YqgF family)